MSEASLLSAEQKDCEPSSPSLRTSISSHRRPSPPIETLRDPGAMLRAGSQRAAAVLRPRGSMLPRPTLAPSACAGAAALSGFTGEPPSPPVGEPEVLMAAVGGLRVVDLNRPKALNALTLTMIRELYPFFVDWNRMGGDVNVRQPPSCCLLRATAAAAPLCIGAATATGQPPPPCPPTACDRRARSKKRHYAP